jgi:hypothetical protein
VGGQKCKKIEEQKTKRDDVLTEFFRQGKKEKND